MCGTGKCTVSTLFCIYPLMYHPFNIRRKRGYVLQVCAMNIHLKSHDEMYLIDLDKVMYFQADDHYAHVHYATGQRFMVTSGLSKIEQALSEQLGESSIFLRMGRKYLVNTHYLFYLNTVKEIIVLADAQGNNHTLHVAKAAIRQAMSALGHSC